VSYWKPGIWDVIVDRLITDATLIGASLLNGEKVYVNRAPPQTTLPFITLNLASAGPDNMFETRGREVMIDLHVWVNERTTLIDAGTLRAGILERIEGDWQEQSNGRPTYGFDRWQPGEIGTTDWYINEFLYVSDRDESEPGLYHDVYTMKCGVYKQRT